MDGSSITLESMVRHHTKDKGDLGIAKVHADLVSKGFTVLFPATEHAPFDLVAYAAGEFHRLQVKYRSARAGAVKVQFRSMWADRNGTHMTPMDKGAIDTVCIYCPETDECYYVRPDAHGTSVTLRIAPSRNGQQAGVLDAAAFRELPRVAPALTQRSAVVNYAPRPAPGVDARRVVTVTATKGTRVTAQRTSVVTALRSREGSDEP